MTDSERFAKALQLLDAANAEDPNSEIEGGISYPRELLYARRLSAWVKRLAPEASEPLLLAARAQHIQRWKIPRSSYPMTRAGYLKWRSDLKKFHAETAGGILAEAGYPPETIGRVQELILKKNFPADPEVQLLEDALCLVFLEFQLTEFAAKTDREKVMTAVRKSWEKMSEQGRSAALQLPFTPDQKALIELALSPG